jgi:hypothetical protein
MQNWTAKSDLTLTTNETGGVTPNIAYMKPLANAFAFGLGPSSINTATGAVTNTVSATAQNFTLGIGATYNGQVTRTETLSFTVSLTELRDWKENSRNAEFCTPRGVTDLEGGLDLKSWLDEALKPAITGELKTGIHPDPGGAAKSAATVSASPPPPKTLAALSENKEVPPPKHPLSLEEKASRDLQLTTALTVLGIPYNLDQFNTPPTNESDSRSSSFCTSVYSKKTGAVVMTYKPPVFKSDATNNPTLESQAATAAKNASQSAYQAAVSPILSRAIKKEAADTAQTAMIQAVQVEAAAPLAKNAVQNYCYTNGRGYLKAPGNQCRVTASTFTIGGTPTPGDNLTVTVSNATLPGGSRSVSYQVQSKDIDSDPTTIATHLTDAIGLDQEMKKAQFGATRVDNVITLTYPVTVGHVGLSSAVEPKNKATETVIQSAPLDEYVVIPLSPQFCDAHEYDAFLTRFFHDQFDPAETLVVKAQENAALAKSLLTPDPPIESIGQSMNFIVTTGLSISPTWSYLHWKGPANGSSLASISGIRTHTLNIALGAPTSAGVNEVQRVLNNAALRQAIETLTPPP